MPGRHDQMIEREKLTDIYERHGGELLWFILGFVKSRDAAEDLLHDVFVKFIDYSRNNRLKEKGIRALLYTIAKNLCIDHLRKAGRVRFEEYDDAVAPQETSPGDDDDFRDRAERLHRIVDRLEGEQRTLYTLKVEMDLTYREVAERLSISERTAKRRMASLMKDLTRAMQEESD